MVTSVETKTIKEICKEYGCSIKEWNDTVYTLCSSGIARGAYQDYGLLNIVIQRLTEGATDEV